MLTTGSTLADLQAHMREARIGAWLVYDFRGSSSILPRLLPPPAGQSKRWTTRRVMLCVPARGEPRLLVHGIDASQFDRDPTPPHRDIYLSWNDLHAWLARAIAGLGAEARVAMDYSPACALPVVSQVDAGTVDLVRGLGAEVVSSADLIQVALARWSAAALQTHLHASCEVAGIKDRAFALIRERLAAGAPITERDVQLAILRGFDDSGLVGDPPVVAVNEHSADPHFEVAAEGSSPIRTGDWILIDLWARDRATPTSAIENHIYSDITWVGFAGSAGAVPERHRRVFDVVKRARDASVALAQSSHARGQRVQGWQLDDAARSVIVDAGHAEHVRHRTGHSLSAGPLVHGVGVNLDNLETRDTRQVLPGVGFTIEPGVYIPGPGGFGVRLEINMFNDPTRGPITTSCVQDDIVCVG